MEKTTMQTPLQLSFKNVEHSERAEAQIRERVDRLEQMHGGLISCHVYVEAPHKHHRQGNLYEVRIEAHVPGADFAVSNKPGDMNAHEDLNVAIRDAFDAMDRQLKRRRRKITGEVKTHEGPLQGRIAEIDHEKGFGQIIAVDGQLVYFHENSVLDGAFRNLKQRDPVELVVQAEESELGPQASTVRPISEGKFGG
jgi:ribosome-associated translation inhibitor RaiA/cold shock CspA family protein